MQYKTMVLELLQERPQLHHRLCENRMLLATVNLLATNLRDRHQAWKHHLSKTRPDSDPGQIASAALEIALRDLQDSLPSESEDEGDPLSLDEAMAILRRHTPPE
jgi:hypothetical protein